MARAIRWTPERYAQEQGRRSGQIDPPGKSPQSPPKPSNAAARAFSTVSRVLIPGLPPCVAECRFAAPRKWRFDYAWVGQMVALEVEGGAWTQGRHTRGKGFLSDMVKYNEAALRGWRVFRCTPDQLSSGEILPTMLAALEKKPGTSPG